MSIYPAPLPEALAAACPVSCAAEEGWAVGAAW